MVTYKKYRKHNKIHNLPVETRDMVDDMLLDTSLTYEEISAWLKTRGHDISRSAIGRYAIETNKLAARLIETREQVRELIRAAKDQDNENLTEGALQIITHKLTGKIAAMDTEIDEMGATDAIRLITDISRTKAYKDKVYAGLKAEQEKANEAFTRQMEKELEAYPDVVSRLKEIAARTLGNAL
jgi:prophage DNA circulation protein